MLDEKEKTVAIGKEKYINKKVRKKEKETSLWPLAAAKWRGELRPPKVEYLARQGLQSSSILASTKSPSLAAETKRSPEAEHPNELPIFRVPPSSVPSSVCVCLWILYRKNIRSTVVEKIQKTKL